MSPATDRIRIATRGSKLALRQTNLVAELLRSAHPGLEVEVQVVTTTGDRDTRPFTQIGRKGIFTSEVEREIVEGGADAAVHSAKDLTAELAPGCAIVCVPGRTTVNDVVLGGAGDSGEERLASLPKGALVGTSSMRRRVLLAEARPDLEVTELRGNLDTRVRKVAEGEADAAILAAAGIERLGIDADYAPLDTERWIPAPGQGALAVEAPADSAAASLFKALDDVAARAEIECERSFATRLEGGCSVPLGCLARADESRLLVIGFLASPESAHSLRDRISGGLHEASTLGVELAEAILDAGGDEILAEVKDFRGPPVIEP
jgi:hydroxymethylbilane synthase